MENVLTICDKCKVTVERINNEIALRTCLEIELAEMRTELKRSYAEVSQLKNDTMGG